MSRQGQPLPYSDLLAILDDMPTIIRHTRRARGLSLREAGRRAGVSFATIGRIEDGQTDMDAATLRALLAWVDEPTTTDPDPTP